MSHWLFRDGASDDHRFRFEDVLTEELTEALSPEQLDALWLGREFEIAETISGRNGDERCGKGGVGRGVSRFLITALIGGGARPFYDDTEVKTHSAMTP